LGLLTIPPPSLTRFQYSFPLVKHLRGKTGRQKACVGPVCRGDAVPRLYRGKLLPAPASQSSRCGWPLRQTVGRAGSNLEHGRGAGGLWLLQLNRAIGDWSRYITVDRLTDLSLIASFAERGAARELLSSQFCKPFGSNYHQYLDNCHRA